MQIVHCAAQQDVLDTIVAQYKFVAHSGHAVCSHALRFLTYATLAEELCPEAKACIEHRCVADSTSVVACDLSTG